MRALSAAELLAVWDLAVDQSPGHRALALLAAGADSGSAEELVRCSIGQSDACLLELREQMFGPQLAAVSSCPACTETLEFEVAISNVRVPSNSTSNAPIELVEAGYQLHFRLPTNLDVANLDPSADIESNRQQLLKRCLISARRDEGEIPAEGLPPEIVTAIAARMAQADPQADVQFALRCPQCGHDWNASFDVTSFVWNEINARAIRLLNDVHVLASTYGWREADILSMTSTRRQAYVELATQ